ncbi:hypothetical protein [uncultured Clostridium sp.]|nr:hypothetical protein [uncultured Clostridium sp.]
MRRVDFELERVMNEAIDLLARTLNEDRKIRKTFWNRERSGLEKVRQEI